MDYLSSGFSKVDGSQDPGVFITCLQTLCSLPYFQSYKTRSFQLLAPGAGSRILEIGCGLGGDAMAISRMIADGMTDQGGFVTAVDASRKMIEAASKNHGENDAIRLCLADACRLPFCDGAFDGARADRVLQHISDAGKAFAEMARTVRDGGRIAVYEPDWGTFIVSPGRKEVCRTMTQLFGDTFPSGWIGRQLPGLFREAGLGKIQIEADAFFTDDLALAVRVFDLVNNAHRAARMGYVPESQAEGWLADLEDAHRHGYFFCSYTGFLVCGEKPSGNVWGYLRA
jgi:SAM-dependent methyltransferase